MLVESFRHLQGIFRLQSTRYILPDICNPCRARDLVTLLATGERQSDLSKVTEQVMEMDLISVG